MKKAFRFLVVVLLVFSFIVPVNRSGLYTYDVDAHVSDASKFITVEVDKDAIVKNLNNRQYYLLGEVYYMIFMEYVKHPNQYPYFVYPKDVGDNIDWSSRMVNVCTYYNDSWRVKDYLHWNVEEFYTFEEFQEYLLGGPYCHLFIRSVDNVEI